MTSSRLFCVSFLFFSLPALAAVKSVPVDCTKKASIQEAIDRNPSPLIVDIHGFCSESVVIDKKDVTLRGTNVATDGIQNVTVPPTQFAAIEFRYASSGGIENLTISGSSGHGVAAFYSHLSMSNCQLTNNTAGAGLRVAEGSFVVARSMTISQNNRGVVSHRGSWLECHGCTLSGNTTWAATSSWGGVLTLLSSTVNGRRGLLAIGGGSYADIDCISDPDTVFPCSLTSDGIAEYASTGATAALYGAGDFSGTVLSDDGGSLTLWGARQTALATPGHGPQVNGVSEVGRVFVVDASETGEQSQLLRTNVSGFGYLLVHDTSIVNGLVQCSAGGDAYFDPGVTKGPNGAVSGCTHATLP